MASIFPLEIYEHILDFVAEYQRFIHAKETLFSTSLVCRGLHPRSRVLMFRTLRFIESDADALIQCRRHLADAPHLAAHVEEVRLAAHRGENSTLMQLFPSCLAVHLPSLKRVFVNTWHRCPLNMHPFFCLPAIRLSTVTTLEYDDLPGLKSTSELDGLLLPYPNIQVLTLHKVHWADLTEGDKLQGKGLPRPLKAPLARLTELRLTHIGYGPNVLQLVNRLGYEQLLEACRGTLARLLLNIAPIRTLVLQFTERDPLGVIEFPHLETLRLEIFGMMGRYTQIYDPENKRQVPYAEIISHIPALLLRISAAKLRVISLFFSDLDIDKSPDAFIGHLAAICDPLEEILLRPRFPGLKAITFDLGTQNRDVVQWQSRISHCFPKLGKLGYIQVKQHDNMSEGIRREVTHFYY